MWFERFRRKRVKKDARPPRGGKWSVVDNGIEITDVHGETTLLPWNLVHEIVAYRTVAVRADEVYLELRHGRDFTLFEETNPDFERVRRAIERRFHVSPGWFESIAHEPYEADSVTLFRRDNIERLRPAVS